MKKASSVIVTGAAGGIGKALAREFAAAGHDVIGIVHRTRPEPVPGVNTLTCDLERTVRDETYAREVFERVRAQLAHASLTALVNNAAVQILAPTVGLTRQNWRQTLDVNLLAPFFWTQALLPELEAARGCVVNIGSIHSRLTKKNFVAYAASKAALSGLTRALAVDLAGRVRINVIEPAAIETDMLRAGFAHDPEGLARLAGYHPSGGIGSSEALARFTRLVVEQDDGFLNGAILPFDGGISGCLHDPGES